MVSLLDLDRLIDLDAVLAAPQDSVLVADEDDAEVAREDDAVVLTCDRGVRFLPDADLGMLAAGAQAWAAWGGDGVLDAGCPSEDVLTLLADLANV